MFSFYPRSDRHAGPPSAKTSSVSSPSKFTHYMRHSTLLVKEKREGVFVLFYLVRIFGGDGVNQSASEVTNPIQSNPTWYSNVAHSSCGFPIDVEKSISTNG